MRIPQFNLTAPATNTPLLLANLGNSFFSGLDAGTKRLQQSERTRTLSEIGKAFESGGSPDFKGAAARLMGLGDMDGALGFLKLGEAAAERSLNQEAMRNSPFSGGGQASTSPAGSPSVSAADPNEVQNRFIGGIRQAGVTNPYGLAAIAATGQRESGFSPGNVNRTWADPSERGAPGTSGGVMSWRGPRLQALRSFAQQRGEQGLGSPETQAAFLAQEDPTLIPRLNQAQSPQEAAQIMANAWRFAGYNRQGGEAAARAALAQQYAARFKGEGGGAPQPQMAQAPMPPRRPSDLGPVQVAESEEDVQRMEAGMPGYGGAPQPVQMAQAQAMADVPVGDQAQGFAVPGQPQQRGGAMPPNDPRPDIPDQALISVLSNPRLASQHAIAKTILDNRMRWRAEGGALREEGQRLQNEKARRELGTRFEPLVSPEDRRAAGIAENDARPYQVNRATGEIRSVGGNQVTVNNQQEREFDKKTGGAIAERIGKMVEDGDQAASDLQTLGDLRQLGQRIQTGGGAAVQGWLAERGIKIGDNVGAVEAYGALIDRLTPQQRVPGSGATSDFDARMFKASLPRLINTPGGNELIIGTMERLADNRIRRAEIAQRVQIGELSVKDGIQSLRGLQAEARQMSAELRERAFRGAEQQGQGQGQQAPAAPRAGTVMDGWRFRGGDPSSRSNWERAQ